MKIILTEKEFKEALRLSRKALVYSLDGEIEELDFDNFKEENVIKRLGIKGISCVEKDKDGNLILDVNEDFVTELTREYGNLVCNLISVFNQFTSTFIYGLKRIKEVAIKYIVSEETKEENDEDEEDLFI